MEASNWESLLLLGFEGTVERGFPEPGEGHLEKAVTFSKEMADLAGERPGY
jgi:hypothetical protein